MKSERGRGASHVAGRAARDPRGAFVAGNCRATVRACGRRRWIECRPPPPVPLPQRRRGNPAANARHPLSAFKRREAREPSKRTERRPSPPVPLFRRRRGYAGGTARYSLSTPGGGEGRGEVGDDEAERLSPPQRACDAQAAGALDQRVSPGPDRRSLGRSARGLAPPPRRRRCSRSEPHCPQPRRSDRSRPGSRAPQESTGGRISPSAGTGACGKYAIRGRGCWRPSGACSTARGACGSGATRRSAPTPPASPASAASTRTWR